MVFEKLRQSLQYSAIYFQRFIKQLNVQRKLLYEFKVIFKFIISDL